MALGQMLENIRHQASDSETSYSTGRDFIEAADQQELLNHGQENWHHGILGFPFLECLVGNQATVIVERQIHS